jgi:hypothetical protein
MKKPIFKFQIHEKNIQTKTATKNLESLFQASKITLKKHTKKIKFPFSNFSYRNQKKTAKQKPHKKHLQKKHLIHPQKRATITHFLSIHFHLDISNFNFTSFFPSEPRILRLSSNRYPLFTSRLFHIPETHAALDEEECERTRRERARARAMRKSDEEVVCREENFLTRERE